MGATGQHGVPVAPCIGQADVYIGWHGATLPRHPMEYAMQTRFDPNAAKSRTYATVKALDKALAKFGYDQYRHVLCYTADGRVTAVFVDRDANPVIFRGFAWCIS